MTTPNDGETGPGDVADVFVMFGATGDLARKKTASGALPPRPQWPAASTGRRSRSLRLDRRSDRDYARDAVRARYGAVSHAELNEFAGRLSHVSGSYDEPATYERLRERLGSARRPLFYLAIPPSMFDTVISGLMAVGLPGFQRVCDRHSDEFLLIGVDIGPFVGLGSNDDGRALLAELGITYGAAFALDDRAVRDYNIVSMPTTVFYTADGREHSRHPGLMTEEQFEAVVEEIAAAGP